MFQEINLTTAGFSVSELDNSPTVTFGGWVRSYDHPEDTPNDEGRLIVYFLSSTNSTLDLSDSGPQTSSNWHFVSNTTTLPTGTRLINFTFSSTRIFGADNDGYLDEATFKVTSTVGEFREPTFFVLIPIFVISSIFILKNKRSKVF